MGSLFDFSQPAVRAKELLIKNAKNNMIATLVVGVLIAIVLWVILGKAVSGLLGFIVAVVVVLIAVVSAINIRNSTFYRLAILEACEVIKGTH